MYFYHPDHLGSLTMITDGNGNVLAGGERDFNHAVNESQNDLAMELVVRALTHSQLNKRPHDDEKFLIDRIFNK